ncbi:hypothetical protein Ga0080574_TMP1552 [Salipiger abyssi]|uniref:Uncharacterized protein n=1 Tax=Salipiger abyssi TaxID=1250539 RepID=A0A1P8URB1_9RHOB|nr:hypothetical protein Ga0080574_TMP1552 [Salipiger abyssi]
MRHRSVHLFSFSPDAHAVGHQRHIHPRRQLFRSIPGPCPTKGLPILEPALEKPLREGPL